MKLADTIKAKSDQLNADDLLAAPVTVRITNVRVTDGEQPVTIGLEGDNHPFKPCKSMRRLLIAAWGAENDGTHWVGREMTLYRDPEAKFQGQKVGGIRISHMSHIERDFTVSLAVSRGKKQAYTVKPLATREPATQAQPVGIAGAEFAAVYENVEKTVLEGKITTEAALARLEKKYALTDEQKGLIININK